MAVLKYGAIVTEIKGKIGGTIFQGGKSGGTAKNKGIHGKAKGYARGTSSATFGDGGLQNRINFSDVAKMWQQLSEVDRDSWSSLLGVYTFTNKFGDVYNGTAYMIFFAQNLLSKYLGLSFLNAAQLENPTIDAGLTCSDYSISGDFERTVANALPVKNYLSVEGSQLVSPNTSLSKLRFRKAGIYSIQLANTLSYKTEVDTFFGGVPPLGSVFYIRTWYTRQDWRKKQFVQLHKITVVA